MASGQRLEKKHPLAIRWNHWVNFPMLAVMIWSGLLIYWANDVYHVPVPGVGMVRVFHEKPESGAEIEDQKGLIPFVLGAPGSFATVNVKVTIPGKNGKPSSVKIKQERRFIGPFPQAWTEPNPDNSTDPPKTFPPVIYNLKGRLAEGMAYHFFFMWFFTINGILYVLYSAISGQWRYLVPQRGTIKHAIWTVLHDMHLKKQPPPRQKFNGAQQIAYTSIILMGIGSVLTGIAIYKPTQFGWLLAMFGGYGAARFIHFWLMIGYVLFFVIHITQVIRAGWNNFRAMVSGYELAPASAPSYDMAATLKREEETANG
jgi:thiosulfate reductase cytochrome b subunit